MIPGYKVSISFIYFKLLALRLAIAIIPRYKVYISYIYFKFGHSHNCWDVRHALLGEDMRGRQGEVRHALLGEEMREGVGDVRHPPPEGGDDGWGVEVRHTPQGEDMRGEGGKSATPLEGRR